MNARLKEALMSAAGVAFGASLVVAAAVFIAWVTPPIRAHAQYDGLKAIEVQVGSRTVQCIQMRTGGGYGAALSCDWSKP